MKKILLFSFFLITAGFGFSQKSVQQKIKDDFFMNTYIDALDFADKGSYDQALKLFLKLDSLFPRNPNLKFNIGVCYVRSASDKTKAIPYLEKAIKNISSSHKGEWNDSTASIDSYFFLGKAYFFDSRFDQAISSFTHYKDLVNKFYNVKTLQGESKADIIKEINRQMSVCLNAKRFIANPVEIKLTNLGTSINTFNNEYFPVLSGDEKTIYFSSDRKSSIGGMSKESEKLKADIYFSNYNSMSLAWDTARNLGPIVNTDGTDECLNLSREGKYMLIHREKSSDNRIFISEFKDNDWSTPVLPVGDINLKSVQTGACFSPDNNIIYFVSDRKGGYGGKDIWYSERLANGGWSKAQNLGPRINTAYDEESPFIGSDGMTLFFSSEGHESIGGFDIFKSLKTSAGWTEPENLGYPINTLDDDMSYFSSDDYTHAFISSIRKEGLGGMDIFKIDFKKENKQILVIRGIVFDAESYHSIPASIEISDFDKGDLIAYTCNNPENGEYYVSLEPDKKYKIVVSSDSYKSYFEMIDQTPEKLINKAILLNKIVVEKKKK